MILKTIFYSVEIYQLGGKDEDTARCSARDLRANTPCDSLVTADREQMYERKSSIS